MDSSRVNGFVQQDKIVMGRGGPPCGMEMALCWVGAALVDGGTLWYCASADKLPQEPPASRSGAS
jgi:hypothetical protein